MPLIELDFHPKQHQLRIFGLALAAILGLLAWRFHWAIGIASVLAATLAVVLPPALRRVYVAMMLATYPLGMMLSWVVLATVYYVVVTPIGWLARSCGRNALAVGRRRETGTYWAKRKKPPAAESYFHQW